MYRSFEEKKIELSIYDLILILFFFDYYINFSWCVLKNFFINKKKEKKKGIK